MRRRLRNGALEARERLQTWDDAVERMGRALQQVIAVSDQLTFSAEWLTLREPADRAARSTALADDLAHALARSIGEDERLQVLDLATGTGANIRALAPRLGWAQDWTAVDVDPRLLEEVPVRTGAWAAARAGSRCPRGPTLVRGPEGRSTVSTARFDLRI